MDNFGSDTNKSSFFITLGDAEFMDDLHVVFGKVIKGDVVLDRLEDEPTHANTVTAQKYPLQMVDILSSVKSQCIL